MVIHFVAKAVMESNTDMSMHCIYNVVWYIYIYNCYIYITWYGVYIYI